jgi:hypothetical protein
MPHRQSGTVRRLPIESGNCNILNEIERSESV